MEGLPLLVSGTCETRVPSASVGSGLVLPRPSSLNSARGDPLICTSNSWAEDMTFDLWTPRKHYLNEQRSQRPRRKASRGGMTTRGGLDGDGPPAI